MKELISKQAQERDLTVVEYLEDDYQFKDSSDDVKYLAMQNLILMERIGLAETNIALL